MSVETVDDHHATASKMRTRSEAFIFSMARSMAQRLATFDKC